MTSSDRPASKLRAAFLGVATLLLLGLSFLLTACATHTAAGPDARTAASATALPDAGYQGVSPAPNVTTPAAVAATGLTKADVRITLKVTEKQCFGSAGCQITVKPKVTVDYAKLGDSAWDVTYSIKGDESGPITDTITLNPDKTYDSMDESLSTPSSKTKLTVTVIDVEKDGL